MDQRFERILNTQRSLSILQKVRGYLNINIYILRLLFKSFKQLQNNIKIIFTFSKYNRFKLLIFDK